MKVTVSSSRLRGVIDANVSKSYAQRAYALAALSSSSSRITRTSWSDDAIAAIKIAGKLGAGISIKDGIVFITPDQQPPDNMWNVGEAGLGLRMFAAVAARFDRPIVIDGHGSLKHRPTEFISHVLGMMGAKVTGERLPLTIRGPLLPGRYVIDGSFSSQLLTGLLIALPLLDGDTELIVENLKSIPYIDMTLEIIRLFGAEVSHKDYKVFDIRGGQKYTGVETAIEADWSGLAFVLVAGAIAGDMNMAGAAKNASEVSVRGVRKVSSQADRAIVEVLEKVGCHIEFRGGSDSGDEHGTVEVRSSDLKAFSFDATHCPDLIPPLCVLATQCEGVSRISGVHRLKHKESDRGLTLTRELGKLGAVIEIEEDVMIVKGKQAMQGTVVDASGDHRIAMALVCAGLVAKGETTITGAETASKSYHNFYTEISALNGNIYGDKELFIKRNAENYLK